MSVTVEKCLQAWTNSLRQMNAKVDIVFFGDSLTYYGDFSSAFPDKVVCNLGMRGDTIQGMIDRVGQVKLLDPKVVYLMAGINDVACVSSDKFGDLYESLIIQIKEQIPTANLVVCSLLPVNEVDFIITCKNEQIKQCNEVIAHICVNQLVRFINLFTVFERNGKLPKEMTVDGIHLKQQAYQLWYVTLCN